MSLIQFCKSLFIAPIGFVDTYLKNDCVSPRMKEKRDTVLYRLALVPTVISYIGERLPFSEIYFLVLKGEIMQAVLLFVVHMLCLAFVCLVLYFLLSPIYRLSCWCFQEAIHWAGGTLYANKGRDLQLYTNAFGILGGFVNTILLFMLNVSKRLESIPLIVTMALISVVVIIVNLIRYLYVKYKIIQKMTNARPFLALFLDVLIVTIVVALLTIVIATLAYGALMCLLWLSD